MEVIHDTITNTGLRENACSNSGHACRYRSDSKPNGPVLIGERKRPGVSNSSVSYSRKRLSRTQSTNGVIMGFAHAPGFGNSSYTLSKQGTLNKLIDNSTNQIKYLGSSAQIAIETALTRMATSGGTLFIKKGQYNVTGGLLLHSMIRIVGEGVNNTTLYLSNGSNRDMFTYATAVNIYFVTFEHLTIGGNSTNNTAGSFLKTNAYVNDILIFDCFIEDFKEYGVDLGIQWGLRITNCVFEFMTLDAIMIRSGANGNILSTKIDANDGNGITLTGSAGTCLISNCYIVASGNNGIYINDSDSNNIIGCSISNNNRITTTGSDIEIAGGSIGNLISGNQIAGSSRSIYNIKLTSASGGYVIGNTLSTAVTLPIYETGATSVWVRDNKGCVTENWNTAANIADGGTINHGCARTPKYATVQPTVSGEVISVTALGTTTITVAIKKISDGSAGSTQTVYWMARCSADNY